MRAGLAKVAGILDVTVRSVTLFSDVASLTRFAQLWIPGGGRERGPVALRLRALGGREFLVRSGTGDRGAVIATFSHRFHVPSLDRQPALIWDLGANTGTTMAHLAVLFESARIVGVELDAGNADLCRRNIAEWPERCSVITAAVWPDDGEVVYDRDVISEQAYQVSEVEPDDRATRATVTALSLNTLLGRMEGGAVDFVKMDIEGAESAVLRQNTEWAAAVTVINVEVHAPYAVEDCATDLRALGFLATIDPRHDAAVWGTRRP